MIYSNMRCLNMPEFSMGFGEKTVEIRLPEGTQCLAMSKPTPIADPKDAILEAINNPIGSTGLSEIITGKGKPARDLTAAVVVSDNTRPVPYAGDSGIPGIGHRSGIVRYYYYSI